eukprot:7349676-Karenia_brevis.AAC.1
MRKKVLQCQIQEAAEQASSSNSDKAGDDEQMSLSKRSGKNHKSVNRIKFLHKLLRLWVPFKRVHRIGCITDDQGNNISSQCGVASALADGWRQTFAWKANDS